MSVFVLAQGKKTVFDGVWGKKWQNSVHVIVEWPLIGNQSGYRFLKNSLIDAILDQD